MLNTHTFSLSPSGVLNVLQSRICIKLAEKETGNKQPFRIQDLVYTRVCVCVCVCVYMRILHYVSISSISLKKQSALPMSHLVPN